MQLLGIRVGPAHHLLVHKDLTQCNMQCGSWVCKSV